MRGDVVLLSWTDTVQTRPGREEPTLGCGWMVKEDDGRSPPSPIPLTDTERPSQARSSPRAGFLRGMDVPARSPSLISPHRCQSETFKLWRMAPSSQPPSGFPAH
ncbi:hypothetical protein H1C71_018397 [Ictidomys tridecemlineatus]|nr:hypothetical protein H1C71_018397 [Ictidomys tridecemlineatus]